MDLRFLLLLLRMPIFGVSVYKFILTAIQRGVYERALEGGRGGAVVVASTT